MALTNFAGSVAVITGGASGIGLATARALYEAGANVVLADNNEAGLQQTEEQLASLSSGSGNRVMHIPTDVTSEEQVQALMQQAVEHFARIDLVVTCAGIGRGGPIDTYSGAEMQRIMNINFMGTYNCVRAALPTMRRQHSGHFVMLSSVAGKLCVPALTAYCATKWAVRGFSKALRAELYGTGIGVTTVYPAWVDTPMLHQEQEGMENMHIEILLTPDQVAREILQAVVDEQTDLTLAPNADIAFLLQIMHDAPDKAEELAGKAYQAQVAQAQNQAQ
jgi:NAD(P)-dependent dehydrogenase (short-subunit alcohol dehydrogenase family)